MATVLVTGGAGFIGSHLVQFLLEKGYSVLVLDNIFSGRIDNLSEVLHNSRFKIAVGDVRDKKEIADITREVYGIVHLAALVDVSASVADPFVTHEVNTTGTLNVLQEAIGNGVKKFVFASSAAVYGEMQTLPAKEDSLLMPISPLSPAPEKPVAR